jgi:hypothetical protein
VSSNVIVGGPSIAQEGPQKWVVRVSVHLFPTVIHHHRLLFLGHDCYVTPAVRTACTATQAFASDATLVDYEMRVAMT